MKTEKVAIRTIFAGNIKKYRTILGYSQEKLAEMAGLSVQSIKDIEGSRRWVSDTTLENLSKALNTEEFQLLLPEKHDMPLKEPLKALMALKKELKTALDDNFEKAAAAGDFY